MKLTAPTMNIGLTSKTLPISTRYGAKILPTRLIENTIPAPKDLTTVGYLFY